MGSVSLSISLVIPTLDPGRNFGALLHRLKGQGRTPHEILVVDSGSQDGTKQTLLQFPEVRLIEVANGPGPASWNRACQEASGDLVVFLGQDALPGNGDWLNHLTAPFEDPAVAGVYGRQEASTSSDPIWNFRLAQRYCAQAHWRRLRVGDPVRYKSLPFFLENSAVRRSVWQGIHFNEHLPVGADRVWARQAVLASYTVAYAPDARVARENPVGLKRAFALGRSYGYADRQVGDAGGTLWPDSRRFARRAAWYLLSGFAWGRLPYLAFEDAAHRYGYQLGRRTLRPIPALESVQNSTLWSDQAAANDVKRAA
ncbi:MAG: glycosyltransferase family 2 protein [Candidatus Dormibacteraeota bacterium]|nr:glycosyltransferase family 2 protein [Candidatus Dormibacteraeota bacterium]